MAGFSENRLKDEIKTKDLRSVYFFVSEDPFKPDFYSQQLGKVFFGDGDVRKSLYFGDELDPYAFLDEVKSLSLWDAQKFLVIKQAERISAKNFELLLPLLSAPLDRCLVIFHSQKADARWKFFQALQKSGSHCALLKFEFPDQSEWNFWLNNFLRKQKKELDDEARALLAEWTLGHLSDLAHLVERAAIFVGDQPLIRRQDVVAVGFRVAPDEVFSFTESLLKGDVAHALAMLNRLLDQGEEPLALIGLLARQYRWLLQILALRAEGKNDATIASSAGIFPAAARHLFPAAKRLGGKRVIAGLQALAEVDFRLKSSRLPERFWLTDLVTQLA
jgi:DNA polymerase-3 subunit delta